MKTKYKFCISCLLLVLVALSCSNRQDLKEDKYSLMRRTMIGQQIKNRGIRNKNVLDELMNVPLHKFVPEEYKNHSYDDSPIPISYNQTISQHYIVADITEILNPDKTKKVLEIAIG